MACHSPLAQKYGPGRVEAVLHATPLADKDSVVMYVGPDQMCRDLRTKGGLKRTKAVILDVINVDVINEFFCFWPSNIRNVIDFWSVIVQLRDVLHRNQLIKTNPKDYILAVIQ